MTTSESQKPAELEAAPTPTPAPLASEPMSGPAPIAAAPSPQSTQPPAPSTQTIDALFNGNDDEPNLFAGDVAAAAAPAEPTAPNAHTATLTPEAAAAFWGDRLAPKTGDGRRLFDELLRRGDKPTMAAMKANSLQKLTEWCKGKGWTLATMPTDALSQMAREAWVQRGANSSADRVMKALAVAAEIGIQATPQRYTPVPRPSKERKPVNPNTMQNGGGGVTAAAQETGTVPTSPPFSSAPYVDIFNEAPVTVQQQQQQQQQQPVAQSQRVDVPAPQRQNGTRAPQPQQQLQQRQGRPATFPQGGRVRIFKIATGIEPGIYPGTRIACGEHFVQDLSNEGSISDFIARWIVPKFGPGPGHPDTTYVVERVDDYGKKLAEYAFAFAGQLAGSATPGAAGPGQPAYGQHVPHVQYPPAPSPNDRLLDYVIDREKDAERRYEEMRKELLEQRKGGADSTTLLLMLDRMKPQPTPWKEVLEATRKQPPVVDLFGGGVAPVGTAVGPGTAYPGGQGFGPDPFAGQAQAQPLVDALVKTTERAIESAQNRPEPPPPIPAKDPLEHPLVRELLTSALHRPEVANPLTPIMELYREQMSALRDEIRMYREQANKPPPSVTQQLEGIEAMMKTIERLRGDDDRPHPLVEGLAILAENADKVSDLVSTITSNMRGVPQLPKPKSTQKLPAGQEQPKQQIRLPQGAIQAIEAMRNAGTDYEGDQAIVAALWNYIIALNNAGDPWKQLVDRIVKAYLMSDSKPEIRSVVTNLFIASGAKKLLVDEGLVEKIASTLWRYYEFLYSQLTQGKTKKLMDAPVVDGQATQVNTPGPQAPGPRAETQVATKPAKVTQFAKPPAPSPAAAKVSDDSGGWGTPDPVPAPTPAVAAPEVDEGGDEGGDEDEDGPDDEIDEDEEGDEEEQATGS